MIILTLHPKTPKPKALHCRQVDMETPAAQLLIQAEWTGWDDAVLVEPLRYVMGSQFLVIPEGAGPLVAKAKQAMA